MDLVTLRCGLERPPSRGRVAEGCGGTASNDARVSSYYLAVTARIQTLLTVITQDYDEDHAFFMVANNDASRSGG
jgi:hypothetical protein